MKIVLLLNPKARFFGASGAAGPTDVVRAAETVAARVEYVIGPVEDLVARAAACDPGDVVISAGGDGTIAALALALSGRGAPLLPLPCGTMNLFSRDLGFGPDPVEALRAGLSGVSREVDLGVVHADGKSLAFLNNIVFGAYAQMAEAREDFRQATTLAESGAALIKGAGALLQASPANYTAEIDGVKVDLSINTIVVANNRYTGHEGFSPRREKLDEGLLGVYLVAADGAADFLARLTEFLNGTLEQSPKIQLLMAKRCAVSRGGENVACAVDGEPMEGGERVEIEMFPRALTVLSPAPVADESREKTRQEDELSQAAVV